MGEDPGDEIEELAALMPTEEELRRFRASPLGTDPEVDDLRRHRLEQVLEAQLSGALSASDATLEALVLAWSHAQPDVPSPKIKPGAPVDPGAEVREAVASDPAFFAKAKAQFEKK